MIIYSEGFILCPFKVYNYNVNICVVTASDTNYCVPTDKLGNFVCDNLVGEVSDQSDYVNDSNAVMMSYLLLLLLFRERDRGS